MRSIDATVRNFEELIEAVDRGEEVTLVRDGVAIARVVPGRPTTAERIEEVMNRFPVDPGWADELEAVVRELRAEPNQERTWPAE